MSCLLYHFQCLVLWTIQDHVSSYSCWSRYTLLSFDCYNSLAYFLWGSTRQTITFSCYLRPSKWKHIHKIAHQACVLMSWPHLIAPLPQLVNPGQFVSSLSINSLSCIIYVSSSLQTSLHISCIAISILSNHSVSWLTSKTSAQSRCASISSKLNTAAAVGGTSRATDQATNHRDSARPSRQHTVTTTPSLDTFLSIILFLHQNPVHQSPPPATQQDQATLPYWTVMKSVRSTSI